MNDRDLGKQFSELILPLVGRRASGGIEFSGKSVVFELVLCRLLLQDIYTDVGSRHKRTEKSLRTRVHTIITGLFLSRRKLLLQLLDLPRLVFRSNLLARAFSSL